MLRVRTSATEGTVGTNEHSMAHKAIGESNVEGYVGVQLRAAGYQGTKGTQWYVPIMRYFGIKNSSASAYSLESASMSGLLQHGRKVTSIWYRVSAMPRGILRRAGYCAVRILCHLGYRAVWDTM